MRPSASIARTSAPAFAAVASDHFGDVNCVATQAGGREAGLSKKDDQP